MKKKQFTSCPGCGLKIEKKTWSVGSKHKTYDTGRDFYCPNCDLWVIKVGGEWRGIEPWRG